MLETDKNKRIMQTLVVFGVMVMLVVAIVASVVSYSVGYRTAEAECKTKLESGNSGAVIEISGEDAELQSSDKLEEGQIPDHYIGSDDPQITVIEYADYPCSHCAELAVNLEPVYSNYGDNVRFIFRHFNVGFIHSSTTAKIAEAAYVVGGEDAYWMMHDKLFEHSADWGDESSLADSDIENRIVAYANEIGIDGSAVLNAYNNSANNGIDDKLNRDNQSGANAGITSTPTVFIDGISINTNAQAISNKLDALLQ